MPRTTGPVDASLTARRIPYALGLILVALAVGTITSGYPHYSSHELDYRAEAERQLSVVAGLNAAELADWRCERPGDAGSPES